MNVSPMSYGTLVCHLQAAGSAKTMVCMCGCDVDVCMRGPLQVWM